MTVPVRSVAAFALLVIAFAAAGCGETTFDDVKAEGAVKSNLEKSLHAKIKTVDCPSGEKIEAGRTFACTVAFSDGKQAIATVKILNKDADFSLVGIKRKK